MEAGAIFVPPPDIPTIELTPEMEDKATELVRGLKEIVDKDNEKANNPLYRKYKAAVENYTVHSFMFNSLYGNGGFCPNCGRG